MLIESAANKASVLKFRNCWRSGRWAGTTHHPPHLGISEFPRKFKFDECHRHIIQLKVAPTRYKTLTSANGNQIEGAFRLGRLSTSSLSNSTSAARNLFSRAPFQSDPLAAALQLKCSCKCRLQVKLLNCCPNHLSAVYFRIIGARRGFLFCSAPLKTFQHDFNCKRMRFCATLPCLIPGLSRFSAFNSFVCQLPARGE